jgi:hypothetical protein
MTSVHALAFNERPPYALLDDAPPQWTGPHVGRRLCEAMQTLKELPMGNGGGHSCWPAYSYTFEDLVWQQEQGELERTQQQQNRIRLMPSLRAISGMETAIVWPAEYLGLPICCAPSTRSRSPIRSTAIAAGWRPSAAAMATRGGSVTTPAARSLRWACAVAACRRSRALTHKSSLIDVRYAPIATKFSIAPK